MTSITVSSPLEQLKKHHQHRINDGSHDGFNLSAIKSSFSEKHKSIWESMEKVTEDNAVKDLFGGIEILTETEEKKEYDNYTIKPVHGLNIIKKKGYLYSSVSRYILDDNKNPTMQYNSISDALHNIGITDNNVYLFTDFDKGFYKMWNKEKSKNSKIATVVFTGPASFDPAPNKLASLKKPKLDNKKKEKGNVFDFDMVGYNKNKYMQLKDGAKLVHKNKIKFAISNIDDEIIERNKVSEYGNGDILSEAFCSKWNIKLLGTNKKKKKILNDDITFLNPNLIGHLLFIYNDDKVRIVNKKFASKNSSHTGKIRKLWSSMWKMFNRNILQNKREWGGDKPGGSQTVTKFAGDTTQAQYILRNDIKIHRLIKVIKGKFLSKPKWVYSKAEELESNIRFLVTHDRLLKEYALSVGVPGVIFHRPMTQKNPIEGYEIYIKEDCIKVDLNLFSIKQSQHNNLKAVITKNDFINDYNKGINEIKIIINEKKKELTNNIEIYLKNFKIADGNMLNESNNANKLDGNYKNIIKSFNNLFLFDKLNLSFEQEKIFNDELTYTDDNSFDNDDAKNKENLNKMKKDIEIMEKYKQKISNIPDKNDIISLINNLNSDNIENTKIFKYEKGKKGNIHEAQTLLHKNICRSYLKNIENLSDLYGNLKEKFFNSLQNLKLKIKGINEENLEKFQGQRRLSRRAYKIYVIKHIDAILPFTNNIFNSEGYADTILIGGGTFTRVSLVSDNEIYIQLRVPDFSEKEINKQLNNYNEVICNQINLLLIDMTLNEENHKNLFKNVANFICPTKNEDPLCECSCDFHATYKNIYNRFYPAINTSSNSYEEKRKTIISGNKVEVYSDYTFSYCVNDIDEINNALIDLYEGEHYDDNELIKIKMGNINEYKSAKIYSILENINNELEDTENDNFYMRNKPIYDAIIEEDNISKMQNKIENYKKTDEHKPLENNFKKRFNYLITNFNNNYKSFNDKFQQDIDNKFGNTNVDNVNNETKTITTIVEKKDDIRSKILNDAWVGASNKIKNHELKSKICFWYDFEFQNVSPTDKDNINNNISSKSTTIEDKPKITCWYERAQKIMESMFGVSRVNKIRWKMFTEPYIYVFTNNNVEIHQVIFIYNSNINYDNLQISNLYDIKTYLNKFGENSKLYNHKNYPGVSSSNSEIIYASLKQYCKCTFMIHETNGSNNETNGSNNETKETKETKEGGYKRIKKTKKKLKRRKKTKRKHKRKKHKKRKHKRKKTKHKKKRKRKTKRV
tara:strand:+ start:1904 stop:5668 length:3765 start_codon:yes stop_codon:yes gene_type:complete